MISLNGTSQYAAVLDEAIDTMVNTWTFLPQQLEPVCLSCIPIEPGVEVEAIPIP
ncbi:hypothetical protein KA478_00130 [Patescibacteria group bacterium]|nr:hypothetical protein [Patescibacteria group bacterium]